jgi:hypothetical protein
MKSTTRDLNRVGDVGVRPQRLQPLPGITRLPERKLILYNDLRLGEDRPFLRSED